MSWRNELYVGQLHAERFWIGTSNGGVGSELDGTELGYIDGVIAGTAAANKALVLNSSSALTSGISAFTVDTSLYVGINDSAWGRLHVYGGATGTNQGGFIRLHTSADHDADDEFFSINVTSALTWIGFENDPDMMIFYGSAAANTTNAGKIRTMVELNVDGGFELGSVTVTATAAELNYLDLAALGTGAASKAVVLAADGDFIFPAGTADGINFQANSTIVKLGNGDWQIDGVIVYATAAELNYLDITTLGTGAASKAVILDGGEDYIWPVAGVLTYGGTAITATGAELNYLDLALLGTGAASKAVVLDAGEDYTWPVGGQLTYGGTAITATGAELNYLDIAALGTGAASKAVVLDFTENYIWPVSGQLTYGGTAITATGAELNYLDLTALGTGAASKAVVLDSGEDYIWPVGGQLTYGGTAITATGAELNYLDIASLGTGFGSKAVVLDPSGDYVFPTALTGIDFATNSTILLLGNGDWQIDSTAVTASAAELNYLDITTLGTGAASKAVVLDAGEDYIWPVAGVLTYGGTAITATGAELNYLDLALLGTGAASKAVVLTAGGDYIFPASTALGIDFATNSTVVLLGSSDWQIDGTAVTASAAELNYLDITTLGTGVASKAVVLAADGDFIFPAGTADGIDFATNSTVVKLGNGDWQIDGTAVTASAAELNFLDDATAGTQVASKAVIADTNINTGVSKVTALHIGVSGSEVAVTATAAELNLNDDQVASVTFAPSGGAGAGTVLCTFYDAAGVQMAIATGFTFWFSSISTGLDFLPITTSVVTAKGAVDARGAAAGSDVFHGITDVAGEFDVTVTAAGDDYYMVVELPNGKLTVAAVLTLT